MKKFFSPLSVAWSTFLALTLCAGAGLAGPKVDDSGWSAVAMFRNSLDHFGVYKDSASGVYGGILWHKQTGAVVRATPTVVNGVTLIGGWDGNLYALDVLTGSEKWRFVADGPVGSAAAVSDGRVFFSTLKGTFYAVKFSDGSLLWKKQFGPDAPLAYEHEVGPRPAHYNADDFIVSSAAVMKDTVIVGSGDGFVYSLDAKSGRPHWTFRTDGRVRSSPAISNGVVYVGSYDGTVYAIDFSSGKLVWRYDTKGHSLNSAEVGYDTKSIVSSPAVVDGTVYIGSRDSHLYSLDAANGTLKWTVDYDFSWTITSPAVRDSVVYNGAADGHLLHALRAADGQEIWRVKVPSRVWSSPAIAGSSVYFTDESGSLHAVDLASGKENWTFQTQASVQSSPVVANGVVYFGSNDGCVYAIRADGAQPMQRAVFFDPETTKLFAGTDFPDPVAKYSAVRDFFKARGYEVLDTAALSDWLAKRIADRSPSVLIFANDLLPASIAGSDPARGPFRQYLNAGGKVVWIGFPPLAHQITKSVEDYNFSLDRPSELLGISFKGFSTDENNDLRANETGRVWGLQDWWVGTWTLPVSSDITVLATNDRGFAGAWEKNYGGAPGTGLVYIGMANWNNNDGPSKLARLAMIAEYHPH